MLESEIRYFINTKEFEETINQAIEDDLSNPEFKDSWKNTKLKDVRLFSDMENVFKNITDIYKNEFSSLLYAGEEVELSDIRNSFELLYKEIPSIEVCVR